MAPEGTTAEKRAPAVRTDLTVVLCTYNGAPHIGEQLRSILDQTVLPGQVHVFDDGSTDDTLRRVRAAWDAQPQVASAVTLAVTGREDVGLGAVRNFERAIAAADTELVALADQDDVWHPGRLEAGLAVLDRSPEVDLVASDADFVDGSGRPTGRTVFEAQQVDLVEREALACGRVLPVLTRRNIVPGMTFLLRRSLFERAAPIPPGAMHDYWLALEAAATNSMVVLPDALVHYRIHGRNAVGLDAGNRSHAAQMRARLRLVRTPLSDLAQWVRLADQLDETDVTGHRRLILSKLRFERRRRFGGRRGLRRLLWLVRLARSGDYTRFDVGGWRGAVKDYLRPDAADLER